MPLDSPNIFAELGLPDPDNPKIAASAASKAGAVPKPSVFAELGLPEPKDDEKSDPATAATAKPDVFEELGLPPPPPRGNLAEVGSQLIGGVRVELPKLVGQALQYVSDPGQPVFEAGKKVRAFGEAVEPDYAPQPEQHGPITNFFAQGARMIAPSVGVGAATALALNPVARAAGVALSRGGEFAIPSLLTGATFGASQGQTTLESARAAGLPEDVSRETSRKTTLIEASGEALGTYFGYKLFGLARNAIFGTPTVAGVIKGAVESGAWKPFAKTIPGTIGVEAGTEYGQNYGETAVEKAAGIPQDQTPHEAGVQGFMGALAMTALLAPFGLAGFASVARRNAKTAKALEDPEVDPKDRERAAFAVQQAIHDIDPEAANVWGANSAFAIANKFPINLDDTGAQEGAYGRGEQPSPEPAAPAVAPPEQLGGQIQPAAPIAETAPPGPITKAAAIAQQIGIVPATAPVQVEAPAVIAPQQEVQVPAAPEPTPSPAELIAKVVPVEPRNAMQAAAQEALRRKEALLAESQVARVPVAQQEPSKAQPSAVDTELLGRVDAALTRMLESGATEDNVHYARLKAKRDAIAAGEQYSTKDVAADLIAGIGGQIGTLTKATGLRREAPVAAPSVTRLTPEAEQLIASVDAGGVPAMVTNKLKKVASDNGVAVLGSDTPNVIIQKLREKRAESIGPAAQAAPARRLSLPEARRQRELAAASAIKVGDTARIMSVDSVIAKTETIGGVRYDLFNGAKMGESRAAVRVVDQDSGNVVSIKQYPDFDMAEEEFNQTITAAKKIAAPVEAAKPNQLSTIIVKRRAVHTETGKLLDGTVSEPADTALKDVDDQLTKAKALLACLNS